ncbi:ubiquitin-conjugating enzyme [Medicago truncatula]|uniref:E2 ubiquitin-conjugating enzyme n=1 Tax=Medicago truncatula TaxID=3880 RepID=A0A072V9L3_MEDTR|nr:ubiquitin-conjugating enzyme [Medicago truncatula]
MDPDVVEIPPPIHQDTPPFKRKKKRPIVHDVIDIDDDDNDDDDLMIIGEINRKRHKGKALETIHEGYGDQQVVPGMEKVGTVSGIQSFNSQPAVSHNSINVEGQGSGPSLANNDYLDMFTDNYMDVDEYALLQAQFDNVDLPTGIEAPFTLLPKPFHGKAKSSFFGSKKQDFADNPDAMKLPYFGQFESAKKGAGSSSSFHSNFNGHNGSSYLLGMESGNPWFKSSHNINATPEHLFGESSVLKSARAGCDGAAVVPSGFTVTHEPENETLRKLRSFKQFDTVTDTSDHYFIKNNCSVKQNPKSWAKKIQEEWRILEEHLPDTIFVRIFESRMDLMRAVIIGAEGTPYHDGLFFFDVYFPPKYPNVPPKVHYHSVGHRLNPNLYDCGKVCLSLLNTWSGDKNQMWTPGVSTMLQVLVSIQGLILNAKPYFNEPGYASLSGSSRGEVMSLQYNENTFILSVRTMTSVIRNPPKNFEDLVVGHFYSRAHDILRSCKAYMEGVQVGCLVKRGDNIVDESKGKCSDGFKSGLVGYVNYLVTEFVRIGVKDCEKFVLPPSSTAYHPHNCISGQGTFFSKPNFQTPVLHPSNLQIQTSLLHPSNLQIQTPLLQPSSAMYNLPLSGSVYNLPPSSTVYNSHNYMSGQGTYFF